MEESSGKWREKMVVDACPSGLWKNAMLGFGAKTLWSVMVIMMKTEKTCCHMMVNGDNDTF